MGPKIVVHSSNSLSNNSVCVFWTIKDHYSYLYMLQWKKFVESAYFLSNLCFNIPLLFTTSMNSQNDRIDFSDKKGQHKILLWHATVIKYHEKWSGMNFDRTVLTDGHDEANLQNGDHLLWNLMDQNIVVH